MEKHLQKVVWFQVNIEFYQKKKVDITNALLDAGFNDTVTFVISSMWEMLELGAN